MDINWSKHLIEMSLHALIVILLMCTNDFLGAKVYLFFLFFSAFLVNLLSAELLPRGLNVYGKAKMFVLTLSDILTFIISIYIVYTNSLIARVISKAAQADSKQYQNIPSIIGLDNVKEIVANRNDEVSSVVKNIESAPFGFDVVTFGVVFYLTSRILWCGYKVLKQVCMARRLSSMDELSRNA